MMKSKPVEFRGSALDDLRAFPEAARREAGYQLDQVQHGREPDDWKPMNTVGRGVRESDSRCRRSVQGVVCGEVR
jgi:phage-related protein